MAELLDVTVRANAGKKTPKPLKRPWPNPNAQSVGKTKHNTSDVIARLKLMNPKE